MSGKPELSSVLLIFTLLCILSVPNFLQAQTTDSIQLTNPRLFCETTIWEDGDYWSDLIRVRPADGREVVVPFQRWLRNSRARIQNLRSRLNSARSMGERQQLRQRLQRQRMIRREVVDCRNGELADPGDDNSDPGEDPKLPPDNNALACDVFGDSSSVNARIINGTRCQVGDSPVVLLATSGNGLCTGTAITPRVVLSAGHCFTDNFGNLDVAWVDVYSAYDEVDEQVQRSANIQIHPNYSGAVSNTTNDTALVILNNDLPVRTVKLLKTNDLHIGERLLIAGYGRVGQKEAIGNQFDGLQAGGMRISEIYQGDIIASFNYDNPADSNNNSNTCNGDSGGPALVYRGSEWVLAGITSYGDAANCGPEDESGFQNVTDPSTLNFIKQFAPALF